MEKSWSTRITAQRKKDLAQTIQKLPSVVPILNDLYEECCGLDTGAYSLGFKLPWQVFTRPAVEVTIVQDIEFLAILIESDKYKDAKYFFSKETGSLYYAEIQIYTMWPVTSVEELKSITKIANNTVNCYGLTKKKK